ncbi:MAG: hypothetical protein M0Z77_09065 [Thermoplasmatales archaeon]|jgi:DNA-3-methyladenine glycosylase II|nr:hypothetical protein [Thermoplasmatales archaeon]
MGGDDKPVRMWKGCIRPLAKADLRMAEIIHDLGNHLPKLYIVKDPFEALLRAILHQAVRAQQSTENVTKLKNLFGGNFPRPIQILTIPSSRLKDIGLSGSQVNSVRTLARSVLDKKIDLGGLGLLRDEEVVSQLRELPGIGTWSAQMFLVFHLGRSDVLMVTDSSLAKATMKVFGLDHIPSVSELETIFAKFIPYRSAAAWYVWKKGGEFTPGLH